MIKITRGGIKSNDALRMERIKNEFDEKHCVVIPGLFEDALVKSILKNIEAARFHPQAHLGGDNQEFARDLTMKENQLALHQVHLLLNNSQLFRFIEKLTGCPPVAGFGGRIYKNLPDASHQLDWHDDTERGERLVGISVNFSSPSYRGGVFQIRERKSGTITGEIGCQNPGDAHIFRISHGLQHRVTPTEGEFPRVSAAGWFVSEPEFINQIRKKEVY